jgi:hypothetical protein
VSGSRLSETSHLRPRRNLGLIDRGAEPCEYLPSSTRHKPELDGIRGMAILGVLATHSAFYIQVTSATKPLKAFMLFGQWGVDLFFALSGFLITGILLETKTAANYLGSDSPQHCRFGSISCATSSARLGPR